MRTLDSTACPGGTCIHVFLVPKDMIRKWECGEWAHFIGGGRSVVRRGPKSIRAVAKD